MTPSPTTTNEMTSETISPSDENRLKSLICSVLQENGLLRRSDSEQTNENSLESGLHSPSHDPFTTRWYSSLIPEKVRDPFKAPSTNPAFFHVRDAQHTALFNPTTAAGGCPEADLLYQAIAFMQRGLDDLFVLVDRQELVDVWKSFKGVSEMLLTRYDLLCALRRSRDEDHIRCLEIYTQPPSGDGAASAKVHREIFRALSKKRAREDSGRDADGPPQSRPKTSRSTADRKQDKVETVTPAKDNRAKSEKKVNEGTYIIELDTPPAAGKKSSTPISSQPKLTRSTAKATRSATPAKSGSSRTASRTRSADTLRKRRSGSTATQSRSTASPAEKQKATPGGRRTAASGKQAPLDGNSKNKKSTPIRKAAAEKKHTPQKRTTPIQGGNPSKQSTLSKSVPGKAVASSEQVAEGKSPTIIKDLTKDRKLTSPKKSFPAKPASMAKKGSSMKRSNPEIRITRNRRSGNKAETKQDEDGTLEDMDTPNPLVNSVKGASSQQGEPIDVIDVDAEGNTKSRDSALSSPRKPVHSIRSQVSSDLSSRSDMTNFTYIVKGKAKEEESLKSSLHTYAGFQWRVVVYPQGDRHKGWMSVYLECHGPDQFANGSFDRKKPVSVEQTEAGEVTSDHAWLIRVKFSVRVLRTHSEVSKAVLQGKKAIVDNDPRFLTASSVASDGKVKQAGLLSDFVGATSHDFSPLADHEGFSKLAPTSCLNPGMYADTDKNVVLIVFIRAEKK